MKVIAMDERPAPPPEGRLIAAALACTGMSIREASRRAGISYGRWRQITSGVQNVSPGSYARVRAPAETLARMARAVGVRPEELDGAQRPDAAAALREMLARRQVSEAIAASRFEDEALEWIYRTPGLSEAIRKALVGVARTLREEEEGRAAQED